MSDASGHSLMRLHSRPLRRLIACVTLDGPSDAQVVVDRPETELGQVLMLRLEPYQLEPAGVCAELDLEEEVSSLKALPPKPGVLEA